MMLTTACRILPGAVFALGLSLFPTLAAADGPATPSRSLSARGPLALSFAAEPAATHWSLETGWPLGSGAHSNLRGDPARSASGFRLAALVLASDDRGDGAARRGVATTLLLDRGTGPSAGWLGVSFGGAREASGATPRLRAAIGVARAFRGVQTEAAVVSSAVLFRNDPRWFVRRTWQVGSRSDTTVMRDTSELVPADHAVGWTTAQATLRWSRGRWAVESVGGLSLGEGVTARRWAQGTARVQLNRRLLLLASAGERPQASLAFDGAAHPHTMLGLQYAPWSTPEWAMSRSLRPVTVGWRTAPAGPGHVLLRVHCRDAHRVELAGDLTDWSPVEMLAVHAGWWALVLPAAPGPHRVQVRLDGMAWQAPAGLPRGEDGPAGPAGVLLAP
jgi:hypothetical protein